MYIPYIIRSSVVLVLSYILPLIPCACSADTGQAIEDAVDQYIGAYTAMEQFSGSVLIAHHGQIIVNKGYGKANIEFDVSNEPLTTFRIGSLTKPFTALAILMLQEQRLLDIHDPLSKYIPDYPGGDMITIHQLLTHTSGIPDHTEFADYTRDRRVYQCDILGTIKTFRDKPLEYSPGERFKYSNSGYILLGYIIEQVAHMPFEQFINQNILQPLGMTNSGFETTDGIVKHHADGYTMNGSTIVHAAYRDMSNASASGAMYSCVEDLYRFDRALYSETLINAESLDAMFTAHTDQYGYGWGIAELFERTMFGHNGETEGFRTNISRFSDDNTCIIILSNYEQTPVGRMSVDLAAIVFGEPYEIPNIRKTVDVPENILKAYAGVYELNPEFTFTITLESGQLYCLPTGQDRIALYPESTSSFFIREVDAQISFMMDTENSVKQLVLHQGDAEVSAAKVK